MAFLIRFFPFIVGTSFVCWILKSHSKIFFAGIAKRIGDCARGENSIFAKKVGLVNQFIAPYRVTPLSKPIAFYIMAQRKIGYFILLLSLFCSTVAFAGDNDSIPFKYSGHICFPCVINDTLHCRLIFDTGAANILGIDSVFLAQSKWKPQRFHQAIAKGAAGQERVRVIAEPTVVQLGTLRNIYQIVPVYLLRDIVDCHIDGIIGINDIETSPFEINFEHQYIRHHRVLPPKTADYIRIPIHYVNHNILFQASTQIGDQIIKGWYLMDTGSSGTIDFTAQTVKKYHLNDLKRKRIITDISNFGIGSKQKEFFVEMQSDQIIIGNDTITNQVISYLPEGIGALGDKEWVGVIGNGIWKEYNIVLDIKHQSIYLQRFKRNCKIVAGYDYGFRNRTDISDGWIVSSLTRGGNAAKAGMMLGDTIVSINGKLTKDFRWEEENEINTVPTQTLIIRGANGTIKRIQLEAKEEWEEVTQ